MRKTYEKPRVEMENFTTDEYASCYAAVDVIDDRRYKARSSIWGRETGGSAADSGGNARYLEQPDLQDSQNFMEEEQERYSWWNQSHRGILCNQRAEDIDELR
jgi:hypothetical protein